MKYSSMSHLLTFAVLSSVSSFAQNSYFSKRTLTRSCLLAVVTGPDGKPASSKQEDIALTLAIIMAHDARSVTVTADQLLNQMSDDLSDEDEEEGRDVSIPYDAAAKNAFEASDKSMAYADFKTTYEADAVALVKSKQPIDVSIPYDAAAKNAFEASDKSMAYADFKTTYEADAVALVKSKQPIDVSIPYDAAAKNVYEASDKSMAYADFKAAYEADAVADVIAKQTS